MRKIIHLLLFLSLPLISCGAMVGETAPGVRTDDGALCHWLAGAQVTPEAVGRYGVDRCFTSESIGDSVFSRMWKKSYKENCTVPRSELRYLRVLHYTLGGKIQLGELVCHKSIAKDLLEIFRTLYDAKYPIGRMVLVDNYGACDEASMSANNTSCFNFRHVAGSKKLSLHSRGLAIDINPLYNPLVRHRADGRLHVEPEAGRAYAVRSKAFDYKISRGDLCHRLFSQHGFRWGGDWKGVKDYQHFEKTGK